MRHCCVVGCNNSLYTINKWMKQLCSKHKCNFGSGCCDCEAPFKLFPFPTEARNQDLRKKWIIQINRTDTLTHKNWTPKAHSRVCSEHFIDREPSEKNPFPTEKLGYNKKTSVKPARREIQKFTIEKEKQKCSDTVVSEKPIPSEAIYIATPFKEVIAKGVSNDHVYTCTSKDIHVPENVVVENEQSHSDHTYAGKCNCTDNCTCVGCFEKQQVINNLQSKVYYLNQKVDGKTNKKILHSALTNNISNDDQKIKLYTGLPNAATFEKLYLHLLPRAKNLNYWNGPKKIISTKVKRVFKKSPKKFGPQRKLSVKDELVMTLMKLKLNLNSELLGDIFGVRLSVVSQVLTTWIKFLSVELKPLIFYPDKETTRRTLPSIYRAISPNIRCVLDCTEIFIERPRDLNLQAQTWSDYKKHNTLKFLVGMAPNGSISFLSEAYGGRASDRFIVNDSGFLDLIDPTDVIMADRGFPIYSDLVMRQATLVIPPPGQGNEQMIKGNVEKTKNIANARIHVERAIGRIKYFQILKNTLPITLVPLGTDIFTICAALSNLLPPLVQ